MEFQEEKAVTTHFVKKWQPFLRQGLIASATWVTYFTLGLMMGSPTVAMPQLRTEGVPISDELASWLSSTFSYSAIPWVFICPYIARLYGRKKTLTFVTFSTIVTFITFTLTTTPAHYLLAEIFMGVQHGSILTTSIIVLTEYTTPEYRGLFLTIKSASIFWGIWMSNLIGTYAHWSYIPKFGLICSLYTLTVFLWPESPYWLASQRRFVEARKAHRWLKGTGENEELELEKLIASVSDNIEVSRVGLNLQFVKERVFYMPLLLSLLSFVQYHLSGKFVITVYAVDVMKRIVNGEAAAYKSMLILDGVTVVSTYMGCFLSRIVKRRTLLLTATGIAIVFLFLMSLYLYLVRISVVGENKYASIFFLAGFSVSISCGPMIMSTALYAELIPAKYKNICMTITATSFFVIHGTMLKIAPLFFKALTMPGLFLFYAVSSLFCLVLMYFYLPETKDKTLLEIEDYFKDGSKSEIRRVV